MRLIKTINTLKKIIKQEKKKGKIIGFVPTMGYIHEGHLSLVRTARKKSQFVVVSIFVNPPQFGPKEDFRTYPRDLKRDVNLLKKESVDLIFNPTNKDIYPDDYKTYVEVFYLSKILCGLSRPTHFRGVTTIVLKLFNIVQPDIAVFGKKDYQQAVIIKKMVRDLNLDVKIVMGRIIREKDGLAMSSRNSYLSKKHRKDAVVIYESLQWAHRMYRRNLRDSKSVLKKIRHMIQQRGGFVDYIEAVDKDTLKPVRRFTKGTLVCCAVYFGKTRLIDNIII
jgi:pantoate--beta-alanine ligase